MEERTIKLSLNKAKEFFIKGGEFKELALMTYTEEELLKSLYPKTWKEFCDNYKGQSVKDYQELSEKDIECCASLVHLRELRDCYRKGWKPDWHEPSKKYVIVRVESRLDISVFYACNAFLSFQTEEIARLFLNNFHDIIDKAGEFII